MTLPRARDQRTSAANQAIQAFVEHDLGVRATVEQVVKTFRAVLEFTATTAEPADPANEFSSEERAALERAGANFAPLAPEVADPVERTRIAYAALLLDTVGVAEAADLMERDRSRIHQRIRERTLWAIPGEGGLRIPRAQFAEGPEQDLVEIDGMGRVVKALPSDLHPVSVLRWLTQPKPDLRIEDSPVSPRDWLRAGGNPDEAVALAEDLNVS